MARSESALVPAPYRGRLAPSPTGYLHLGHARTFWIAQERARQNKGVLIFRNEDLDPARCKPEFVSAMFDDLRWFGLRWQEGPDCAGPFGPYTQSERTEFYQAAFGNLRGAGFLYPCTCSRKDVLRSLQAPHESDEEPIYPGTCRGGSSEFRVLSSGLIVGQASRLPVAGLSPANPTNPFSHPPDQRGRDARGDRREPGPTSNSELKTRNSELKVNWRFRVPDGERLAFEDGCQGPQTFVAGRDFGDFIVWRSDDVPAYQLAVVVDDAAMRITEVVRGADLLASTARQLLLYRALGLTPPAFYHCELVRDESGVRLAKRHDALSLRALRERGVLPEDLRSTSLHL